MAATKTERLLNLVICLLASRRFLSKEQIRAAVPQYAECASDEAFERMFERDKDELRELGIPLETGSNSAWFDDEPGYRIDRERYALPEVHFEPDELAVLGLASRVWQQASLAGAASRALVKLKASGVEPDESSLLGVEPRVRTSEPAFDPMYAAVRDRVPVTFDYRAARDGKLTHRTLEPWGIVSWHGRWYVVGHDRDREDTRAFRLGRVVGEVRPAGRPGSYPPPPGVDLREQVRSIVVERPTSEATLRVREGAGWVLRRRGTVTGRQREGFDEVRVSYGDVESLADELAAHGSDVVVEGPLELREAVVRRLRAVLAAGAEPAAASGTRGRA